MWFHNLNRIAELASEDDIQRAAQALLRLPTVPVLKAIAVLWSVVLLMVFSFVVAVRLAAYLPLPF